MYSIDCAAILQYILLLLSLFMLYALLAKNLLLFRSGIVTNIYIYIYTVRTRKLWNTKLTVILKSQVMILNNQANFKTKDCAVFTDLFYKTVNLLY